MDFGRICLRNIKELGVCLSSTALFDLMLFWYSFRHYEFLQSSHINRRRHVIMGKLFVGLDVPRKIISFFSDEFINNAIIMPLSLVFTKNKEKILFIVEIKFSSLYTGPLSTHKAFRLQTIRICFFLKTVSRIEAVFRSKSDQGHFVQFANKHFVVSSFPQFLHLVCSDIS